MNDLFNLSTYFRFLGKNKLYTVINVFGLSVSLMFVILIAIYTVQELSTDKFQEKADRIYALGDEEKIGSAYKLAAHIAERYPEVEKICPVITQFKNQSVFSGETKLNANLLFTDSTFFDVFSFGLIDQNSKYALVSQNDAVISETFARKAFGSRDPIGQSLKITDNLSVTVTGIMHDIKNSTIPYGDILIPIENVKYFNAGMVSETFSNYGPACLFILEKEGADLISKTDDMLSFFKEIVWVYQRNMSHEVVLVPLNDIYFMEFGRYSSLNHGDKRFVMILMSVGILILIFSLINYINLTMAQTGFRAKEMSMRRLLGSHRKQLFARLMSESAFLGLLSFTIAVFLAFLFAPYAGTLLATKIDMGGAFTLLNILLAVVVTILLGMISGLLPAIAISNAKPVDVVKGSFSRRNKMVFSKFFIIFQNIITIMMLAAAITMIAQTRHLINAPLGYNSANIIDIPTDHFEGKEQISAFTNDLKQLACVKRVALSQGTPFDFGNNHCFDFNEKNLCFQFLIGDTTYLDLLGFKVIKENQIATSGSYYFTPLALREAELSDDIVSFKFRKQTLPIAGIMDDVRLGNITIDMRPVLFGITDFTPKYDYPWNILVEIQGDPKNAYEQVKQVYEGMMQLDFHGMFIDDRIEESFAAQKRTSQIVSIFAGIALLISFLGLFAMSTYFVRQRTKEIAIRKVHGSTNPEILGRLVRIFLVYVLIAFVIATPIIRHIMSRWLSDYSYRIDLGAWIFMAAGMFCLLVSFVSVYWQSRIAANANPVDAIKVEH